MENVANKQEEVTLLNNGQKPVSIVQKIESVTIMLRFSKFKWYCNYSSIFMRIARCYYFMTCIFPGYFNDIVIVTILLHVI